MRRSRNNFNICTPSMSISDIQAIDSVGDPPLPIPNREVKPDSADGTALSCGRVGHRHFFLRRALVITKALFLFMRGCYFSL